MMTPSTTLGALRAGVISLCATIGLAAAALPVSAQSFLDGKSNGMVKCVNAILGDAEVKKVNVHGHHFNCKPMGGSGPEGYRQIWLSHSQIGPDDQYMVDFRVDPLDVLVSGSVRFRTTEGLSPKTVLSKWLYLNPTTVFWAYIANLPSFEGPQSIVSYAGVANAARDYVPPKEVDDWDTAAFQIAVVAIAELGRAGSASASAGIVGGKAAPASGGSGPATKVPTGNLDLQLKLQKQVE